jgi:hypothetical protein
MCDCISKKKIKTGEKERQSEDWLRELMPELKGTDELFSSSGS